MSHLAVERVEVVTYVAHNMLKGEGHFIKVLYVFLKRSTFMDNLFAVYSDRLIVLHLHI